MDRILHLTDQEIDCVLDKLDGYHGDADAEYLKQKIYGQQHFTPGDEKTVTIRISSTK